MTTIHSDRDSIELQMSPNQVLALYPPHTDTIVSLLSKRRKIIAQQSALQFESRTWSYAEVDDASSALAHSLALRGVCRGDRIALVSTNSDLSVVLFLAVAKLGAIFVPINPDLTNDELCYILKHSGATAIASRSEDVDRIKAITESFVQIPWLLPLEQIGLLANDSKSIIKCINEFAGDYSNIAFDPVQPDYPVVVIYTSGTTGFPKGVIHSHKNYVWAAEAFVERVHIQPTDRLLSVFPFFHVNALFYSLGGALAAGATMITTNGFSASRFWNLAVESGATQFNILAAVGTILGKRSRSEFNPNHRITKIYGGPISSDIYRLFREEFHIPTLIEGYGMTEIPGACNNPFVGPHKIGSMGKPSVHPRFNGTFTEMRVEDDEGQVLPPGEIGELVVKTPIIFQGYLDDAEQTKAAFRNGWFLTGDLVRMDDAGYFYFVARKKDIIRRRGENISGAELDRVLSSHPDIAEAAAIGVPSELGEEEILVAMVAKPSRNPQHEEIVKWCRDRLAPMKIPRFIVFVDSLPYTPSHRVAKYRLKEDPTLLARAIDIGAR